MKKIILLIGILFVSACTQFNSVAPFDEKQAALVLRQYYVASTSQQMIKLNLLDKNAWQKIDISPEQKGSPVVLIPVHESRAAWSEKISTQIGPYVGDQTITAKKMVQSEIQNINMNCKQVDQRILAQTTEYVLYRVSGIGCKDYSELTEIGKVFNGHDAVYLVRYQAMTDKVSAHEINAMQRVIGDAELVRNPRFQFR